MKFKIDKVLCNGKVGYWPKYKKFLFWHSLPLYCGYGEIHGPTTKEYAIYIIERYKKKHKKLEIKRLSSTLID